MEASKDERLEHAIAALNELIELVNECGFNQSALFLDMARLQLRLELNGITDDEFSAFCDALERGELPVTRPDPKRPRPRRNGDLRLMQRAWRHPEDSVAQRGGTRAGR